MSMTIHILVKEILVFIVTEKNLTFRNINKNFFSRVLYFLYHYQKPDISEYLIPKNMYSENLELTYDLI